MRAVVKTAGVDGTSGTEVRDCPLPEPARGEVLVRVAAASICGTDKHIYHWDPSIHDSVVPPRIYGHEFCGFIEQFAEEDAPQELSIGDYVSAEMHVVCGECAQCRSGNGHICARTRILGLHQDGAFAEFVKVPLTNIIKLDPEHVPIHIGAFLDALGNAVHTTQVVDLAGKSVMITGFGPIGAMAAAIAEHCGAGSILITDVSDHALDSAREWALRRSFRGLHCFNVRTTASDEVIAKIAEVADGGAEVLLEMSGAPAAINLGLASLRMGGFASLLGLPAGHAVTIDDYTRNVIFKGITLQGIIGRRMYSTWQRMLSLLRSGLDVEWVVQRRFQSLDAFHDAVAVFDRHEALKVVLFPAGEEEANRRLRQSSAFRR